MNGFTPVSVAYAALASLSLVPLLTYDTYTSRLSTIALSRFLLDLRRTALRLTLDHRTSGHSFSENSNVDSTRSELRFNPHVLDDLGGPLSFDSDDEIEVAEGPDVISEHVDSNMVAQEGS